MASVRTFVDEESAQGRMNAAPWERARAQSHGPNSEAFHVREDIETMIEHIRQEHTGQADIFARVIIGQIRRLSKPIRRTSQTGTGRTEPPIIPAIQDGIDMDIIRKVELLVIRARREFMGNHQMQASRFAREALAAWSQKPVPPRGQ